jgi:hypothetical protein
VHYVQAATSFRGVKVVTWICLVTWILIDIFQNVERKHSIWRMFFTKQSCHIFLVLVDVYQNVVMWFVVVKNFWRSHIFFSFEACLLYVEQKKCCHLKKKLCWELFLMLMYVCKVVCFFKCWGIFCNVETDFRGLRVFFGGWINSALSCTSWRAVCNILNWQT